VTSQGTLERRLPPIAVGLVSGIIVIPEGLKERIGILTGRGVGLHDVRAVISLMTERLAA
jgi:hypothetical protein